MANREKMVSTIQEKRIWNTSVGDILISKKTMLGENYPFGDVQLFTQGKEYEVLDVLPLSPCVVVLDDEGDRKRQCAERRNAGADVDNQ